jgi:hypothetical protein
MGTTLTGTTPQDTYDSLIKVTDNGPLSATAKYLSDGLGNDSVLALSTAGVGIGTDAPTAKLHIYNGEATIGSSTDGVKLSYSGGNSSGVIDTAFSDNNLEFRTNGNTKMWIANAGNVGIGVTPSAWSSGYKVLQGSFVTSYGYDQNVPANLIVSNAYNDGTWKYGISAPAAKLNVVGWTGVHTFEVAASGTAGAAITWNERARIDNDGLKFNGDTAAANALDDYEEGTWTMGVAFGNASVGVTYSSNTGTYTKIGRQVTVSGYMALTSKGSSTGIVRITGLPFTIQNSISHYSCASLWLNSVTFANQYNSVGAIGTTNIAIEQITEAGVVTQITNSDFANDSEVIVSFTYFV